MAVLGLLWVFELIFPPLIGLANNGDFYRIAPQSGVYYLAPGAPETHDPNSPGYVGRLYRTGELKNPQGYYSSGLILMWLARAANDSTRGDSLFDIRWLGGVHVLSALLAVAFFVSAVPRSLGRWRWLVAAMVCFMWSDVGYFAYFNSFYSESASLIFLLVTVAAALRLSDREGLSRQALVGDVIFLASSGLFLTAKPQNAVLAPFLVLFWWSLRWRSLRTERRTAFAALIAGGLMCVGAATYLVLSPFQEVNRYNHVFSTILGQEKDPIGSLQALGLDAEYAALAGTHWWTPLSSAQQSLKAAANDELGSIDVVRFYLERPGRFAELFARGADAAFVFRPEGLGNFERSRGGPPAELSQRLDHWTTLKQAIWPRNAAALLGAGLVSGCVWIGLAWWQGPTTAVRLGLCLWTMMGMQLLVVLLGGGDVELVRHLFLFNALSDLSWPVLALACAGRLRDSGG